MNKKNDVITFGLHLMLDAYGANEKDLDDMKKVFSFLKDGPGIINMKTISCPLVIDADATATGKDPGGISGSIIIAESHLAIHTFAKRGFYTLDLYSCNDFSDRVEDFMAYVRKTFPYKKEELQIIKRGLSYPKGNI